MDARAPEAPQKNNGRDSKLRGCAGSAAARLFRCARSACGRAWTGAGAIGAAIGTARGRRRRWCSRGAARRGCRKYADSASPQRKRWPRPGRKPLGPNAIGCYISGHNSASRSDINRSCYGADSSASLNACGGRTCRTGETPERHGHSGDRTSWFRKEFVVQAQQHYAAFERRVADAFI